MTWQPFEIIGEDRDSHWLLTCDHAANTVPDAVGGGTLGLPESEMQRHIAYDIGAAWVTRRLAERLQAPAILSDFSRLVIDPNRGEDDPTLIMQLYDGTVIPGNRVVDAAERTRRLELCYRPYDRALARLAARRDDTVLLSIHSFTPAFKGREMRPWHVGVLYADDHRLADPLIRRLRAEPDLTVGDNQPYTGHLEGDAMDRHAIRAGRHHALIELRQDLIASEETAIQWADRLAPLLDEALTAARL